ncbi:tetraspanin-1 [Monodelphis domestica]|uniref:tetraspanin-1 n=1 Tax=Monodelphis domestica TaxID=13616 RepID=UPI0024E26063|nr:tetraspanin-1 [Monodelphis domestica]
MSCFSFLKVIMIIFNFLIFLCGAALLGVGIWVSVDGPSFLKIFGPVSASAMQFVNVGYFLIAAGCALLVLGFLGCYGAQKESKCLLLTFFSILLIIFIAEIAAAVVALVYTTMAENLLGTLVVPVIKKDYGKQSDITQIWNSTMDGLNCCGFNNYTDFEGSPFYQTDHLFPTPCCGNYTTPCTAEQASKASVRGCFDQLLKDIRTNAEVVGGVAAGFGAFELAAMVVAMYLYCKLDKA